MTERKKFIDVRRVIEEKNPKLLNILPGFGLNYLKRILHEDELNHILDINKGKSAFDFCEASIQYFDIKLTSEGIENIPKTGGAVLAMNHPLGGMDAMALGTILKPYDWDLKFVANDILMTLPNLKDMLIGINKHGKNAKDSLREFDAQFGKDQLIGIFPAGLVSRRQDGVVKDLEWKKTFITRAKKHGKPIVPTYINGELSNFFYRLSNLRMGIGMKANIEMLYLADELFKQRGKHMKITFGAPIDSATFDRSQNDKKWAAFVKEKVYQLAE